jgi:hypothetical protein
MTDKERDLIWLVVVFVLLIVILPVLMMWGMWDGSFMHGMMGYGGVVHASHTTFRYYLCLAYITSSKSIQDRAMR